MKVKKDKNCSCIYHDDVFGGLKRLIHLEGVVKHLS